MKVGMGIKKTTCMYFICNLVGWSVITCFDWMEEKYHQNYTMIGIFALSIIIGVLYIIYQIKTGDIKEAFLQKLMYKFIWLAMGAVFGFVIGILVADNKWIVPQAQGGWENFLNGIEYWIFGVFFVGVVAVAWFLFDMAVWIYSKIKNSPGS